MTGIREQKKRQTRKAIVDAAIRLFSENGFEQTSMDELARAAGVGKGTIYGYFKTKSEIFIAFCEEEIEYAFAALDAKLDADAPLHEQLVAQIMGQLTYVTRNREFGRIFAREMLFPGEKSTAKSRDLDLRYFVKLAETLGRAQQRGELAPEADLILLIGHLHALYMVALSSLYLGDLETLEEAELLLKGLVRQTLDGPATRPFATPEKQQRWESLKKTFLQRRHLELS